MFYIYAYLRTSELTPYYIGKGQGNRAYTNNHSVVVPKDRRRIVILESNLTEIGALALERRLIRWWGRKDLGTGILRNQTDGGDGCSGAIPWNKDKEIGSFLTEKGRNKISKANKGIKKNHGEKVSAAAKGKPKTEEHKKKLSEAGKGNVPWNTGKTKENNEAVKRYAESLKGRIFTDEHRAKLSESHKGKANTEEQKAKISAKLKGRIMSEETKKKMSEARKRIWEEKKNAKR
jgi:hypothetical protein